MPPRIPPMMMKGRRRAGNALQKLLIMPIKSVPELLKRYPLR
jgi:hypothetical protein